MDILHLDCDELDIECQIRNIGWFPEMAFQNKRHINEVASGGQFSESEAYQDEESALLLQDNVVCAVNTNNQPFRNGNDRNKFECWNCGNLTHLFKDCNLPITNRFCFGCGTKNVIKVNCLRCRNNYKQGNLQRGFRNFGALKSQDEKMLSPKECSGIEAATNTDPEFYRILQRKQD